MTESAGLAGHPPTVGSPGFEQIAGDAPSGTLKNTADLNSALVISRAFPSPPFPVSIDAVGETIRVDEAPVDSGTVRGLSCTSEEALGIDGKVD